MPRVPITKRWPGEYCGRIKIYTPDSDAMRYSSVEIEGRLPKEVAEHIKLIMLYANRLTPSQLLHVAEDSERIREEIRK